MDIRIPVAGGEMPAYMALPLKPGAGVVVIQEIFGVTPAMKAICDFFASRQFVAICPEIFWRTDPGAVIPETDRDRALAARDKVNSEQAAGDVSSAVDFLRKHSAVTAGVGVAGYCWGGLLSYLTATQHKPDAAVSYYGVGIDKRLDDAKKLACPMMFHFGGKDKAAGPDVAAQVQAAFKDDPRVTVHVYPDADHAFARPGGHNFHPYSADQANMRTLSFFVEKLVGKR